MRACSYYDASTRSEYAALSVEQALREAWERDSGSRSHAAVGGWGMLTAFYQTAAQLCFTLLGLWWLVLQTKYPEWIRDRARRRQATSISLYFLLPGGMSLIALLATDIPLLWRTSFAVACALGAVVTLPVWDMQLAANSAPRAVTRWASAPQWIMVVARWSGVALYTAILLVAIAPQLARQFHLAPLLVAGVGLSLLVVLGVSLAWMYFLEPAPGEKVGETRL